MPDELVFKTNLRRRADAGEQPPPPIPFTIQGTRLSTGDSFEERFTALGVAPAIIGDDLISAVYRDLDGQQQIDKASVVRFFRCALVTEDVDRFQALVSDKDRIVELDDLADMMKAVAERMMRRPTGPAGGRAAGWSADGRTSVAVASGQA